MSQKSKTSPRFPYSIQNTPTAARSSLGRTFVYVLMLNVTDNSPSIPFYVGQTNNLSRRFGNHSQVAWHYSKFNRPVKIWIAGTVDNTWATDAEQDLIRRASENGYWMSNTSIKNKAAKRKAKEYPLTSATINEIAEYLDSGFGQTNILQEWQKTWDSKSARPPQIKKLNYLVPTVAVEAYMSTLKYKNENTKKLSMAIAKAYITDEGAAYIDIAEIYKELKIKTLLPKQLSYLKRIWSFKTLIGKDTPDKFLLSVESMTGIARMLETTGWTIEEEAHNIILDKNNLAQKAPNYQRNPTSEEIYAYVKSMGFTHKGDKDFNLITALAYNPEVGYAIRNLSEYDSNLIRDGRIEKLNKIWITRSLPKTGKGTAEFFLQEPARLKILARSQKK